MTDASAANLLVSILTSCCGQLEYTRLSLPRLLRHSRPPFELICVDAGSLDGTTEYLCGVADAASTRVEVVRRGSDREFGLAVGEAFAQARGEFLVWVNNDVLVPKFWLQQLVALASSNRSLGMVGAMSNIAPEPQRVPDVPYRLRRQRNPDAEVPSPPSSVLETAPFDQFAQEHRERNTGEWMEVDDLGGFCFLLSRPALAIGALVEDQEEAGVFDGHGLSIRVRHAGFRLGCCRDLFVHRFGTR